MASFADVCRFTAVSTGTGNFVVSAAVTGYQTPASAQAVDGAIYKYRAESTDLSQWEVGYGPYTVSSTTLARTTILFNSSGGTSAINFTAAPQVSIVGLAEDLTPVDGAIFGLTLSTAGSSATFSVATGWASDSTAVNILRTYSSYSKTTSSWAVGSGNGGLDTGAIANSTWYHAFIIKRLDTGVTDFLVSLSATAPTMPTNYTLKRRIGSMKTNGSAQWTKFFQDGNVFTWDVPTADVAATNPGTAAVTRTLTTPLGLRVQAQITVTGNGSIAQSDNPGAVLVSDLSTTDNAPIAGNGTTSFTAYSATAAVQVGGIAYVFTNTSSQVRSRLQLSAANTILSIATLGWVDTRGRDA